MHDTRRTVTQRTAARQPNGDNRPFHNATRDRPAVLPDAPTGVTSGGATVRRLPSRTAPSSQPILDATLRAVAERWANVPVDATPAGRSRAAIAESLRGAVALLDADPSSGDAAVLRSHAYELGRAVVVRR